MSEFEEILPKNCIDVIADILIVQAEEILFELRLQPGHGLQIMGGSG